MRVLHNDFHGGWLYQFAVPAFPAVLPSPHILDSISCLCQFFCNLTFSYMTPYGLRQFKKFWFSQCGRALLQVVSSGTVTEDGIISGSSGR